MEEIDLSSPGYWESDSIDVRINPKRDLDAGGLVDFLHGEVGVRSAVVLATSGSSGTAKWVVLSKEAILASARAVNAHCGVSSNDRWLAGLSSFHVGGMGIFARACSNGADVFQMPWDSWTRDGRAFVRAVRESDATLTAMTPVHLYDLVRSGVKCPESLRGVLLGGGRVEPSLVDRAGELGWPVWVSYGMSEAASQIATSIKGAYEWLPILPHWECRLGEGGILCLRGEALFSGYAVRGEHGWRFEEATDESGWFVSGDRCELDGGKLRFVARADDGVKVSWELISLSHLNERVHECGLTGLVVAIPHLRRENELVLVIESGGESDLARYNDGLSAIERASRLVVMGDLPRTEGGKVDRAAIRAQLSSAQSSHPKG